MQATWEMLNLICFDNQHLEELQATWEMLNLTCVDNQHLEAVTGDMRSVECAKVIKFNSLRQKIHEISSGKIGVAGIC